MFRRLWCVLPFFFISCKDSPPGPTPASSIQLAVEDVSCTEAWLKVSFSDSNEPRTIALRRDGQTVLTAQLTANDSTLIDEGLLPNHAYTYQAVRMQDSIAVDASVNAQLTTLDTTSHNWSFEIDTLGDGNSSLLYDVAIISDTLVYAVGEIYSRDSTGQIDPILYNLAIWSGPLWHIQRVPVPLCPSGTGYFPLRAIHVFGPNDIWMTGGGEMVHWDGQQFRGDCSMNLLLQGGLNKIWGNGTFIYAVGNTGTIVYSPNHGGIWYRIQSGTTIDMRDIWGCSWLNNDQRSILGIASSPGETRVLALSGATVHDTLSWPITQRLRGLWMSNRFTVYVSGPGIWRNTGSGWMQMPGAPGTQFLTAVRGTSENNIFAVAWRGVLAHFNGASWHQFTEIPTDFNFDAVAVSENMVVAVGFTGGLFADKAGVVIGRRVP